MASEKLNEKYILYQVLAQNLEGMKQQIEMVEQQLLELRSTLLSMEDVNKLNDTNEIFVPMGSGCFSRGKITDSKKILVGVGAGVFVDRDMESAKTLINERFNEIEKAGMEIEEQMKNIANQMNTLAADIQSIAAKDSQKS
jgi:prefoldin alpha subunit